MKYPRPQPVVTSTICSLCDEPWESHGDDPTVLDCLRLLKAKRYTPSPYVNPVASYYQCPSCGQWVYGTHNCFGRWWYTTTTDKVSLTFANNTVEN